MDSIQSHGSLDPLFQLWSEIMTMKERSESCSIVALQMEVWASDKDFQKFLKAGKGEEMDSSLGPPEYQPRF